MPKTTAVHEEMKRDLMKVYREVVKNYEFKHNEDAFDLVVRHPAPRFYVCSRRALQHLSPLTRGDRSGLEKLSPLKREMYEALFATVMRLWQEEKYWGQTLNYVLRFAVQEPAPRFYIGKDRMEQIWREKKDEWCGVRRKRNVCDY